MLKAVGPNYFKIIVTYYSNVYMSPQNVVSDYYSGLKMTVGVHCSNYSKIVAQNEYVKKINAIAPTMLIETVMNGKCRGWTV